MTGTTRIPTTEEEISIPVKQIQETDTTQARVVEQGGNDSGGSSLPKEFSEAEQLFNSGQKKAQQDPSLERKIAKGSVSLPHNTGFIGYDTSAKDQEVPNSNVRSSFYWNATRREGVPV